jgi:hypothetical protein
VNWALIEQIGIPLLYCGWLGPRPWFPRTSTAVLLITNFVTALCVTIYDITPVSYVLEERYLQAIVAFEVVTAAAAVAAFLGNRAALFLSYLAFAIHLGVIVWVVTHPFRVDQMDVLDYG